jgi:hypothetical protein
MRVGTAESRKAILDIPRIPVALVTGLIRPVVIALEIVVIANNLRSWPSRAPAAVLAIW